jgi:hypothetical protein
VAFGGGGDMSRFCAPKLEEMSSSVVRGPREGRTACFMSCFQGELSPLDAAQYRRSALGIRS